MYELVPVGEKSFYVQSPAKIGIVMTGEKTVCLIDSGSDKDAGRKVRQILDANSWQLTAIYNTHANADHIGGNKYLQGQTGCRIYAPGIDCAITNYPILEPAFLYGGYPPTDLRHKFLLAQESSASLLTADVLPEGFELIPLPGHFFNMVGFRTPDDTVFLADCLSSKETLQKYQIGFIYDVKAYLETLTAVQNMQAHIFVPSHAEATDNIAPLARYNAEKVSEIASVITGLCREPICFDILLQKLFGYYNLTMDFSQNVLVGSTVKSYLAYLRDGGIVEPLFDNEILMWKAK